MGKLNKALSAILSTFGKKKPAPKHTVAVIVAGGSSTRMGEGVSKQWITLCGLPVIVHTLLAFEQAESVQETVLVVKEDELARYEGISEAYGLRKPLSIVVGGNTRQQSVKNGFLSCADRADFVAIHDGARCLVTPDEIDRVCRAAFGSGAATAVARVHDTVKIITADGHIEKTVDRDTVRLAQTPQVFRTNVYHAALAVSERDTISVTDDCSLAEHIAYPIKTVECSSENLKITTAEDRSRAEAILINRKTKKENSI